MTLPTHPDDPTSAALERLECLGTEIRELLKQAPAQLQPFTFVGSSNRYQHRSQHPPLALSVGFVNPTEFTLYAGLSGERAAPNSNAFTIPPKRAMVVPVSAEKFDVGVDPESLKEASATIFVLRFTTVQPFFVGSL